MRIYADLQDGGITGSGGKRAAAFAMAAGSDE